MNATNKSEFEDIKVNIKIKLSALWTSVTLCYLYGDYFELYVPKKVEDLISGDNLLNSPMNLFLASVLLAIPAVMVCLSILLKPIVNRWLNILFGVFFTAIMVLIAATSLTEWRIFYVFLAIVESILTSLIVWFAWTWPRQIKD
jgi:Family of unknown function (DUF6326)